MTSFSKAARADRRKSVHSPRPTLQTPPVRQAPTSERQCATTPARSPLEVFQTAASGSASTLPYQAEMERAFRHDFSRVRVFADRPGEMSTLNARAATMGQTVVFADAIPSKETVAHELTHVVQNQRGKAGTQVSHVSSVQDLSEREAAHTVQAFMAGTAVLPHASPQALIQRSPAKAEAVASAQLMREWKYEEEEVLTCDEETSCEPDDLATDATQLTSDSNALNYQIGITALNRSAVMDGFRLKGPGGVPLVGNYKLWSREGHQEALANPRGFVEAQTARGAETRARIEEWVHQGRPGVTAKAGKPAWQADLDEKYAELMEESWIRLSRENARDAALSGTVVEEYGPRPPKSQKVITEIPAVRFYGGAYGALGVVGGGMEMLGAAGAADPYEQAALAIGGISDVTGGLLYGTGANLMDPRLMEYGKTIGSISSVAGLVSSGVGLLRSWEELEHPGINRHKAAAETVVNAAGLISSGIGTVGLAGTTATTLGATVAGAKLTAAAIAAAPAAAVLGAAAAGFGVGAALEEHTRIGHFEQKALHDLDDLLTELGEPPWLGQTRDRAETNWDEGNYLTATGQYAKVYGAGVFGGLAGLEGAARSLVGLEDYEPQASAGAEEWVSAARIGPVARPRSIEPAAPTMPPVERADREMTQALFGRSQASIEARAHAQQKQNASERDEAAQTQKALVATARNKAAQAAGWLNFATTNKRLFSDGAQKKAGEAWTRFALAGREEQLLNRAASSPMGMPAGIRLAAARAIKLYEQAEELFKVGKALQGKSRVRSE